LNDKGVALWKKGKYELAIKEWKEASEVDLALPFYNLSKAYYPKLKSTYYALIVSLVNLGQNIGTLLGAWIFTIAALFISSYHQIFYIICLICALTLGIAYLIFSTIDPIDYELERNL